MARSQNEIDRDSSVINLLSAILDQLKILNTAQHVVIGHTETAQVTKKTNK